MGFPIIRPAFRVSHGHNQDTIRLEAVNNAKWKSFYEAFAMARVD